MEQWIDATALSGQPEISSRNSFACQWVQQPVDEIAMNLGNLTLGDLESFLRLTLADISLSGVGVEIGSGAAILANTVAKLFPAVSKIYAVEIVPNFVRLLEPKITGHFGNQQRVAPVIGDFDDLKLADGSIDFVVEMDSIHHSNNMDRTIAEIGRVLKPGGKMVAIDRAHPNVFTEAHKKFLLDIEYSPAYKRTYGLPVEKRHTRRDGGEHEPREREWRSAFAKAGMRLDRIVVYHRRSVRAFTRVMIAQLPFALRHRLHFKPNWSIDPRHLLFYLSPALTASGDFRIVPMALKFKSPRAFDAKQVIVATKAD